MKRGRPDRKVRAVYQCDLSLGAVPVQTKSELQRFLSLAPNLRRRLRRPRRRGPGSGSHPPLPRPQPASGCPSSPATSGPTGLRSEAPPRPCAGPYPKNLIDLKRPLSLDAAGQKRPPYFAPSYSRQEGVRTKIIWIVSARAARRPLVRHGLRRNFD